MNTRQSFELITPDGRVYHFPPPTRFEQICALLESAALPAAIVALSYAAGFVAQAIEICAIDPTTRCSLFDLMDCGRAS